MSTSVGLSDQSKCSYPDKLCPSSPRIGIYSREMSEMEGSFDAGEGARSIRDVSSTREGNVINAIREVSTNTSPIII